MVRADIPDMNNPREINKMAANFNGPAPARELNGDDFKRFSPFEAGIIKSAADTIISEVPLPEGTVMVTGICRHRRQDCRCE